MSNEKFMRVQISDLLAITSIQANKIKKLEADQIETNAALREAENKLIAVSNLIEEMRYQLDKIKPAGYND